MGKTCPTSISSHDIKVSSGLAPWRASVVGWQVARASSGMVHSSGKGLPHLRKGCIHSVALCTYAASASQLVSLRLDTCIAGSTHPNALWPCHSPAQVSLQKHCDHQWECEQPDAAHGGFNRVQPLNQTTAGPASRRRAKLSGRCREAASLCVYGFLVLSSATRSSTLFRSQTAI